MRLSDQVWPDVDRPVLAVPVGSCEQHGPHLPLSTDAIIAEAVAMRLAAQRPDVLVGPTLGVTASGEHAGFPGTLSIGNQVMTSLVVELVRSADWAAGVVLVNGHGGNRTAVDRACTTLHDEHRQVLSWWPHLPGADAHAGRTETSLVMAIAPVLVRDDRAATGERAPLDQLAVRLRTGGVAAVSPNGVLGDPTGASVAEGVAILDELAGQLVMAFDSWTTARVAHMR